MVFWFIMLSLGVLALKFTGKILRCFLLLFLAGVIMAYLCGFLTGFSL